MQQIERYEQEADDAVGLDAPPLSELVREASNGQQAAWGELLARFGEMIAEIGRRQALSPQQIMQLQQATWLRLVENLDRIEDPERLGSWLAETARRETEQMLKHLAS